MNITFSKNRASLKVALLPKIVLGSLQSAEKDPHKLWEQLKCILDDHSTAEGTVKNTVSPVVLRYLLYIVETFPKSETGLLQSSGFRKILESNEELRREILQEYYWSCQKAALNFVLDIGNLTVYRSGLSRAEWKLKYARNRAKLSRYLYVTHPWSRRVVELWHKHVKPTLWVFSEGSFELSFFEKQLKDQLRTSSLNLQEFAKSVERYLTKYANIQMRKKKTENVIKTAGKLLSKSLDTLLGILVTKWTLQNLTYYHEIFLDSIIWSRTKILVYVHVKEKTLQFEPQILQIQNSVVSVCDDIVRQSRESLPDSFTLMERSLGGDSELRADSLVKVNISEEVSGKTKSALNRILESDAEAVQQILEQFRCYDPITNGSVNTKMEDFIKNKETPFDDFAESIISLKCLRKQVQVELSKTIETKRFEIRLNLLQETLLEIITAIIDKILQTVQSRFCKLSEAVCRSYAEYADIALTIPKVTAKWIYQRDAVENLLRSVLPLTEGQIRCLSTQYSFMCDHMELDADTAALYKEVLMWQRRMNASLVEHRRILRRKRTELESSLKAKREMLNDALYSYNGLSDKLQTMGDLENLSDYLLQTRSLSSRLEEAERSVAEINEEERHFGWILTQYPLLEQVKERLDPYLRLFEITWLFLEHQQQWLDSKLGSFNPDAIVRETDQFKVNFSRLEEELPDVPSVRHLVGQVESRLRDFNKVLPLIRTLGNPALRERHWEQIWDTVGIRLSSEAAASLQQLLALQLGDHLGKLEVISSAATQELALENLLIEMKQQWNTVVVPLKQSRDGDARVLGDVDYIQRLLEDHIIETQTMRRSPFVKPFEKDAREWEQQLIDLQLLIDSCVSIQNRWSRLEPILASPDVLTVAPEEARKFSAFDKSWRDVLQIVGSHPQIFGLLYVDKLTDKLTLCGDQADQLEACLQKVLEAKRLQYPRFFLLAESELCELLSHSRNPTRIGSLLWRLYEGVSDLQFSSDYDITSVVSAYGEILELNAPVSFSKCKGQLDKFLNKLEAAVKDSLSKEIRRCVDELETNKTLDFLLDVPAQVAVLIACVFCSRILEKSIDSGNLATAKTIINETLVSLAEKIRKKSEKIRQLTSVAVSLLAIYFRDFCQVLEREKFQNLSWNCALKPSIVDGTVRIKVLDTQITYNMEYLGRPPSHLPFQDTLRSSWNISTALHSRSRCAGVFIPSSSVEFLRSLAENCGQRLFILEISPQTSASQLQRFLKGAIFCDLWLCCSRLERSSDSTKNFISALLSQLRIPEVTPVWLELIDNPSSSLYSVYGTIDNPGNPGTCIDTINWSRCTYFPLPSLEYLAEIKLQGKPQTSWKKVLELLEQFQDFALDSAVDGVQILNSICKMSEKIDFPQSIYHWGINRVPKSLEKKFQQKILELFPGALLGPKAPAKLIEICKSVYDGLNLHFSGSHVPVISSFLEALEHPLPILLTGPKKTGKTKLIQICAKVYSKLQNQTVDVLFVSGQAYARNLLLGSSGTSILAQMFQKPTTGIKIIVISGKFKPGVHQVILESFQNDGILRLETTETVKIADNVRIVIELEDLRDSDPSWIVGTQIVSTTTEHLTLEHLTEAWFMRIKKEKAIENIHHLESWINPLLTAAIPEILQYNSALEYQLSGYCGISSVQHMLKLFTFLLEPILEKISTKHHNVPDPEWRPILHSCFIFSIVWTLGVPGFINDKNLSSTFLRSVLERLSIAGLVPKENLIYDYKLNLKADFKFQWSLWNDEFKPNVLPQRDLPVDELFIQTVDSIRVQYLLNLFVSAGLCAALMGTGASGKTSLMNYFLKHKLSTNTFETVVVNFSAAMDSSLIQDILMGKLERRRRAVYGPPLGKRAIVFLDDYFVPEFDSWTEGQVPALLKTFLEHNILYDKSSGLPLNVVDVQLVATCRISSQSSDFFVPVVMETVSHDSMIPVFSKMLLWHLDARGFGKEFDSCIEEIVQATRAVYDALCSAGDFSAVSWNIRDFARCIHGMLLSVPETIEDVAAMKRLWIHEAIRVFSDRLSRVEDCLRIQDLVSSVCETQLKASVSELIAQLEMADVGEAENLNADWIFFCDFADPKADARCYAEVVDFEHLQTVVDGYVREFNNMNKRPMPYFIAVRSIIRTLGKISRILKQPSGHVIICGSTGVGRHSIARMAAHVSDCELHQFDYSENSPIKWTFPQWLQSFKTSLLRAAAEDKRSVFLVSQWEIDKVDVWKVISHVIGSGDIMYLFDGRQRIDIVEQMRAIDLQKEKSMQTDGSSAALLAMFESRLWQHIRIIVVMETKQLTEIQIKCRQFPTHCQVIWIHPWSEETLYDVFGRLYKETDLSAAEKDEAWNLFHELYGEISVDEELCSGESFQYENLMDWIKTSLGLTKNLRNSYRTKRNMYVEAVAKIDAASKRIQDMENCCSQWKQELLLKTDETDDSRTQLERDIDLITCQMDRAKDLLQNLSTYDSEWRLLINSLDNSIEKCHLQSIATASVLIYCGHLPESKRIEKFRKWLKKWQNSHGNLLNDTDYAALLDEEKKEISSLWRITNLPWENHCINGCLILNYTTRYPLIIDPYNISSQWINAMSITKETKPVYLDAANPRYLEQLSGCLQLGATAVLSVTDCGYDPALTSLLLKQTFSQGTSFFVKLGANVVEFSGEFQLFLVAKQPRADFQHVTVVDFTLEDPGLFETFASAFVNNERPDSEERIQLAKQNSEISQQRSELETNLLNSLIAAESDWIEKETVINMLLPNLIQSRMLKEKLAVVEQAQHRLEAQRESFIPMAKFSSKIFKILSTSKYFSVSLDHFLQIVLGSLEDDDGEDDVDADPDEPLSKTSSVFRQISGRIFRKLKPGLNFLQKRLLSLVLCFYTAIEEETITQEFFQKFINGSGTELVELVQEQSGNPGEFQVFLQDLSAGPLMLSTVLEKFAKKFLKINFNVELEEYVNIVMNLPQSTPILILASLNVDVESIIQKLAKELDFPDDRIRYSATCSQNALNFAEMEDCMRRGNWLILQGFSHLRNQEENIHFLMENINSEGVSPDFRMWIVWITETKTDLEHLNNVPHNLLGKSRHFVFTEPQWSAWEVVREMFQWGKFQKLLTNLSETTKMLFSSLVCLRVIIWDRWNVLVPVTYLIRLLELSTVFQETPDWKENITVLLFENLKETIEANLHTEVSSILEELISRSNIRWNEIIDTIGQFVTNQTEADLNPVLQLVDFDCFCQREQTVSEKLWKSWRKMFQKVE